MDEAGTRGKMGMHGDGRGRLGLLGSRLHVWE